MIRSASIRRMLIAVLMLLTVTPDGVLRPCCCTRSHAEDRNAQDVAIDVVESSDSQLLVAGSVVSPVDSTVASNSHKFTGQAKAQLPACCQKRLQAAKRATSCCQARLSRKQTVGLVPAVGLVAGDEFIHDSPDFANGLNDSRSCRCRAISNTAKVERLVFRQIVSRIIAVLTPADELAGMCFAKTQNGLFENSSASLDQRSDSARLCRWVI